jgi:LAS superfamily LD-carboxypeptidase LdcB
MNKNERTNATILSAIVITLLSTMAFVFVGSTDLSQKAIGQAEEIFGENATFTEEIEGTSPTANQTAAPTAPTANQTAAPTAPTANQTSAPTAPTANQTSAPTAPTSVPTANETIPVTNLTRADIESFRENLNSAREGVQDDDAQTALDSINAADGTLYVLIVEEPKGPVAEKLSALQDTLDTARESLRANALEKALQDLNNADSQVLVITEMLPAEEAEESD